MEKLGQNNIYSQFLGDKPILRTYKGDQLINEYKPLYTPPVDWKDIRTDCPENSIALYAAHSRINNPNYNIERVTGPVNYTVVGNPTINNGVVSGFSTNDYLTINGQAQTDFEVCVSFTTSSIVTQQQIIWGQSSTSGVQILSNGSMKFSLNSVHSAGTEAILSYILSPQTKYKFVAIKKNDKTMSLSLYNEANELLDTASAISAANMADLNSMLGKNTSTSYYFRGSIDLNNTYIKVNNQMWFGSQMQLTSANPNIYLKGDGNSCILTDYAPSYKTSMDIKVGDVNNWICGARFSAGTIDFGIAYYLATFGKNVLQFSDIQSGAYTFNYGQTLIRDGVTIGTFPETSSVGNIKMLLFGIRTEENSNISLSQGKIYYCKIYNEGSLVYHFVPVPQGLVIGNFTCPSNGLFDIIEQKFYSNQGTGDFTYGNDSPETITYDNLGFTATCVGGYNVFIDGTQYRSTYASGAQCNITWSTSGITTGDDITTPSALKAHKIWIEPATSGNNITAFQCRRVAASSEREEQGILWAHFNIINPINITYAFNNANTARQYILEAITAKNNLLAFDGSLYWSLNYNSALEYLPVLKQFSSNYIAANQWLAQAKITKLTVKNFKPSSLQFAFFEANNLSKINYEDWDLSKCVLVRLPSYSNYENVDLFNNNVLREFSLAGTSTKLSTLKSLRVSNEAPFTGSAPQINVSYTGMDRDALVQLFNDLPYNVGYEVVGSPTITDGVVSGFSGGSNLQGNYLKTQSLPNFNGDVEIVIKFKSESWASSTLMSWIVSGYQCGVSISSQGKSTCYFSRTAGDDTTLYINSNVTLTAGQDCYLKVIKTTGGTLTMYNSTDGVSYNQIGTTTNTNYGTPTLSSYFRIGVNAGYHPGAPFNGSIDLNNTYIKINGEYWFRGQPAMTKTLSCVGCSGNQDKLTIVGSPTITDGVASGFSSANNLETSVNYIAQDMFANNYEFATKITPTGQNYSECYAIRYYNGSTLRGLGIYQNKLSWSPGYPYSSSYVGTKSISADWTVTMGTTYWLKGITNGPVFSFYYSLDGQNYTLIDSVDYTGNTFAISKGFLFGATTNDGYGVFNGSIDLNNTYIKVNDELWFGREQYLLPEDKAIVTNKGWGF